MITDHMKALVDHLLADSALAAIVGTRVFGGELPAAQADLMPRQALVVSFSGNPGGPGSGDYTRLVEIRFDFLSYGETPFQADAVRRAAYDVMKAINRTVVSSTLLHRAEHSGGPVNGRDRDTDWPFIFDSWNVLAAERAVA